MADFLVSGRRRGGRGAGIHGTREQLLDCVGRLGAVLEPVLHPALVDDDLFGLVLVDRVVIAQFFDDLAVAGGAMIHGVDAPEGVIFATESECSSISHIREKLLKTGD